MEQPTSKADTRRALLVSVTKEGTNFCISLDDVVGNAGYGEIWIQKEHVTNKTIKQVVFEQMQFDEKELAHFAYHVMARLKAFLDRREN